MSLTPMEQLIAFADWEREHNPHPEGKPHVADWAIATIERQAAELERLRENVDRMKGALVFYREAVSRSKRPGPDGRDALRELGFDGGHLARTAIDAARGE